MHTQSFRIIVLLLFLSILIAGSVHALLDPTANHIVQKSRSFTYTVGNSYKVAAAMPATPVPQQVRSALSRTLSSSGENTGFTPRVPSMLYGRERTTVASNARTVETNADFPKKKTIRNTAKISLKELLCPNGGEPVARDDLNIGGSPAFVQDCVKGKKPVTQSWNSFPDHKYVNQYLYDRIGPLDRQSRSYN